MKITNLSVPPYWPSSPAVHKVASPDPLDSFETKELLEVDPKGSEHELRTPWKGEIHRFTVTLGPSLSQALASRGVKVDLERAEMVTTDGSRHRLFSSDPAPGPGGDNPWMLLDPTTGIPGLPTNEVHLLLNDQGKLQVKSNPPFEPNFEVYRDRPFHVDGPSQEQLRPMQETSWLASPVELPGGAGVFAPTPELANQAAAVFESICGPRARSYQADEDSLPAYIFVVPDQHHWTALPHILPIQEEMLAEPAGRGFATFLGTEQGWMIFVNAGDLDRGGYALRHELYHLLENKYLTPAEVEKVDRYHLDLVEQGGPFQSTYGYPRDEFLTTMGEEFEEEYGPEGKDWLATEHPTLHELLVGATGRAA